GIIESTSLLSVFVALRARRDFVVLPPAPPGKNRMPVIAIDSLSDLRVEHYRNLKDRELERRGRRFIAEGEHLVRRLLASDFTTESLLLADRRVAEIAPLAPPHLPVYAAPQALMDQILGLKFHSGVIACGVRKPPRSLDQVVPRDKPTLTL